MEAPQVGRRQILQGAGALGAAAAAGLLTPSCASAGEKFGGMVGGWQADVPATSSFPAFRALFTFAPGGGAVTSTSLDLAPQFLSTPGYGSWEEKGERSYGATFIYLAFDPGGNASGSYNVRAVFDLDDKAEHFTGSFTLDLVDLKGNKVVTDKGTIRAARIKVEPP